MGVPKLVGLENEINFTIGKTKYSEFFTTVFILVLVIFDLDEPE